MAKPPNSPKGFIMVMSVSAFSLQYYSMIYRTEKRHDRNHAVSRKQM